MSLNTPDAQMGGARLRQYWSSEVDAMLATYRQFERLVPAERGAGAAHRGEDGRYVEALLREYLAAYLPRDLEILTGFILRAAVITGQNGYEREASDDEQSSQLDLIVFDSSKYPVYQRFGENAVVPPEGVVAVISVKKHLRASQLRGELDALREVARLCRCEGDSGSRLRSPFLGLVGMGWTKEHAEQEGGAGVSTDLKTYYAQHAGLTFDEILGYIGALDSWSITKRRPPRDGQAMAARLHRFAHRHGERHLGLQFLLSGILSVYYDATRGGRKRPGFTAFESGRGEDEEVLVPFDAVR